MATTFLFDANIPIAFSKIRKFDFLKSLFSTESGYDNHLIMHSRNLSECSRDRLMHKIKSIENFSECSESDDAMLQKVKDYWSEITRGDREMHTRNDADYYFVMAAIMLKPDFVVTNDRSLSALYNKFKGRYYGTIKSKSYLLAHLLALISKSFRKELTSADLLAMNLNVYHGDELESLYKNMHRAGSFQNPGEMNFRLSRNQSVFVGYRDNSFRLVS